MKTKKIIESLINSGSSNRTTAITALIGGLAAGAAIGILFGTEKGKTLRQKIRTAVSSLFDQQKTNECSEPIPHSRDQYNGKQPKSDIKNIIRKAHTEQSLS